MSHASATPRTLEELVAQVADEFSERLDRGEQPEIEAYAQRHPQIAAVIRQVSRGLQEICRLGAGPQGPAGDGKARADRPP